MTTRKLMTIGAANAIKILAAERMGMVVAHAADARRLLEGAAVHAIAGAGMCTEASRLHNAMRLNAAQVDEANLHAETLGAEYGYWEVREAA